jgi:LPXTG-motif cell wall-anchored protein
LTLDISQNPVLIETVTEGEKLDWPTDWIGYKMEKYHDDEEFYDYSFIGYDTSVKLIYDGASEPSTPNVVVPSHVCTAELLEMTEAVDADCETKGNIAYYTCTTCGKLYADEQGTKELKKADTVLPALGHDWDEGSITKLAEAGQPGEKRYVCQRDSSHTDIVEFDLQTKPVLAEVATTDALTEAGFDTAESIQTALIQVAAEQSGYTGDNAATYEVTLYISLDDGLTWVEATEENIPAQGITVVLPYPQGTNGDDYDFVVTHMFGADGDGHKAGDVETLAVTKTAEGLRVTVKSLSPFGVAWKAVEKAASGTNNGASALPSSKPKTGDNSPIALWAGVFVLCAAAVVITAKKRYSRT